MLYFTLSDLVWRQGLKSLIDEESVLINRNDEELKLQEERVLEAAKTTIFDFRRPSRYVKNQENKDLNQIGVIY